jgi:hypothetical protein
VPRKAALKTQFSCSNRTSVTATTMIRFQKLLPEGAMELLYGLVIQNVAAKLREADWNEFIDSYSIREHIECRSSFAEKVRKAWELANPISQYYAAAESKTESVVRLK